MSSFRAKITVDAGDGTRAIFDSVSADNRFYPENPVRTEIDLDRGLAIVVIRAESEHLPHLRANLNSTLRLIQASHESIESARKRR